MQFYKRAIEQKIGRLKKSFEQVQMDQSFVERFWKQFVEIIQVLKEDEEIYKESIQLGEGKVDLDFVVTQSVDSSEKLAFVMENYDLLNSWIKSILTRIPYRVVMIGVNDSSIALLHALDKEKTKLVSVYDDQSTYIGQILEGQVIQKMTDLENQTIDYILTVTKDDQTLNNLTSTAALKTRFVDYKRYMNYTQQSPEFFVKMLDLIERDFEQTEGVLTGLSYVQKGVDEQVLSKPFVNLANPSQDLYYDFLLFKYFYENELNKEKLKYAIVGLSYYSLHYDLSMSNENMARVNYYYPLVKSFHNAPQQDAYKEVHESIDEVDLFKKYHTYYSFTEYKEAIEEKINNGHQKEFNLYALNDEEILANIDVAKRNFSKNYLNTLEENTKILKEYLSYLKENQIKPILLVCPMTKLYQAFTPSKFQEELYGVIEKLKLEGFNFQFLDYYYSDEFTDQDFYDSSHINKSGSQKLAEVLNRDISW